MVYVPLLLGYVDAYPRLWLHLYY